MRRHLRHIGARPDQWVVVHRGGQLNCTGRGGGGGSGGDGAAGLVLFLLGLALLWAVVKAIAWLIGAITALLKVVLPWLGGAVLLAGLLWSAYHLWLRYGRHPRRSAS